MVQTQYQLVVQGHLPAGWADWFEGMSIVRDRDGRTILSGPVVDQAALHGLLARVRDLGLVLIAVSRIEPDGPAPESAH